MPHLNALYSKGMPDDMFDLAQRLVTHGPPGHVAMSTHGPLGIVYRKGNAAH